jgi:glycosyltransferase involved in cell wall biosynthesis
LLNAQIGDIVGISVGSLISRKGHDQTIAALQRVPKTSARLHIAIVGSGPEEDTLRMMAHQAGVDDRLHWLGQRDDVQSLVAGADFFLTAAKEEVQPLSVIEAMLLRKPIVASAIPAHAEMVSQNQDGLLADATDPDRFAAAILHAATDVEWRRRTSAHLAMTAADRYGFDQFMMGFTDLYSFLIAQPEHEFAIPRALRWMPGYRRWLGSMLRARLRLH